MEVPDRDLLGRLLAWTRFTDAAKVAPDVQRDAEWLADRYHQQTGKYVKPETVQNLMPENHPRYPWNRKG